MNQRFSGKVILSMLLFIMHSQKKRVFILMGIIFLGALVPDVLSLTSKSYANILGTIIIGTGIYLSTLIGGSTHKPQLKPLWLPIPLSTAEKTALICIISHLLLPLITLFFTLSTAIISSIAIMLTGGTTPIFSPFSVDVLIAFVIYIIIYPLYTLSSYRIRNHSILGGTAIIVAGISTIAMIIIAILGKETLFSLVDRLIKGLTEQKVSIIQISTGWQVFLTVLWSLTFTMMPLFLWAGVYYSIEEEEYEAREP